MQSASRYTFDISKTQEALKKVLLDIKCPISGHKSWTGAPGFVEIRPVPVFPPFITSGQVFTESWGATGRESPPRTLYANVLAQDASYPAVMAICNGCGYVALFSAVALGLIPGEG